VQRALCLAAAVLCAGCAGTELVQLRVHAPAANTIQAEGFADPGGEASERYDSLLIDLRHAPPFMFAFADGQRARSTEITAELLARHHAPLEPGYAGMPVSVRSGGDARGGPYWSVAFFVGSDGLARSLSLQTCSHRLPNLLGDANGSRFADFPIRQGEITALFGGPAHVLRYKAFLLERCRF
jgi:hypothetical protein